MLVLAADVQSQYSQTWLLLAKELTWKYWIFVISKLEILNNYMKIYLLKENFV